MEHDGRSLRFMDLKANSVSPADQNCISNTDLPASAPPLTQMSSLPLRLSVGSGILDLIPL